MAALGAAPDAAAQTGDGPPRVSLGAGVGLTTPLHGDFDFTPATWGGDVRVAMSRHAVAEFAFSQWHHAPEAASGIGERTHRAAGVNVLFSTAGRVRGSAGGGIGVFQVDRPSFSSLTSAAQIVGGGEVDLAAGFAAFGQAQLVLPFRDPGLGDVRFLAGIRWGVGR